MNATTAYIRQLRASDNAEVFPQSVLPKAYKRKRPPRYGGVFLDWYATKPFRYRHMRTFSVS